MSHPPDLACSFCGKSRREVKKLVAGPGVTICDECVALCVEIVGAGPGAPAGGARDLVLSAIAALPRPTPARALRALTSAAIELAGEDPYALRLAAHAASQRLDLESALEAYARIPPAERSAADALASAAFLTRLGRPRDALDVLGALAGRTDVTPEREVARAIAHASARLAAEPLGDDEVREIEGELNRARLALSSLAIDDTYRRALQNDLVHARARVALALGQRVAAESLLREHLIDRPGDAEALALLAEVHERTGEAEHAAIARTKALELVPEGGGYAARIAGRSGGPFR